MFIRASWSAVLLTIALILAIATPALAADSDPFPPITSKLTSPPGKRLKAELDAIDREIARLQGLGQKYAARAQRLIQRVRPVRDRLDNKPASGPFADANSPELHVVGLYEGDYIEHNVKFGSATVLVEAIDRPIVLVLSGHSPIRWNVHVAPGATLRKVILSGYDDQVLESAPVGAEVETHTHSAASREYVLLYNYGAPEIANEQRKLKAWTGLDVATSQGWYSAPRKPIIVGPSNNDWRIERALFQLEPVYGEVSAFDRAVARNSVRSLRFTAIRWKFSANRQPLPTGEVGDFMASGPIEDSFRPLPRGITRVAVDPRGPTIYALTRSEVVRFDPPTGALTPVKIPANLPRLSWPCGIALDTKRNRIVVTTFGGVGYMYAYELDNQRWSLLGDMNNIDLASFTYADDEDCFYGVATSVGAQGLATLHRFDSAGKSDAAIELHGPLPFVGGRDAIFGPAQLIARGGKLILLTSSPDVTTAMTTTVIDPKSREILMSQPVRACVAPETLSPAELKPLWQRCASADTVAATKAMRQMCAAGDATVAFLRENLSAPVRPQEAEVARLIRELDNGDWKAREAAQFQLTSIADQIGDELKAALNGGPSGEVRNRISLIFGELDRQRLAATEEFGQAVGDPALRRRLRAVRILESIATPDAVEFLRDLAADAPQLLTTTSAASALRRL